MIERRADIFIVVDKFGQWLYVFCDTAVKNHRYKWTIF